MPRQDIFLGRASEVPHLAKALRRCSALKKSKTKDMLTSMPSPAILKVA
jgi:hypothetical protein